MIRSSSPLSGTSDINAALHYKTATDKVIRGIERQLLVIKNDSEPIFSSIGDLYSTAMRSSLVDTPKEFDDLITVVRGVKQHGQISTLRLAAAVLTSPLSGAILASIDLANRAGIPLSVVDLTGPVSGTVKDFPDRREVIIVRPANTSLWEMGRKYGRDIIDPDLLKAPDAKKTDPEDWLLGFVIPRGSIGKDPLSQEKEYGPGANLLLMAIAREAYREKVGKNLFRIGDKNCWVRGQAFDLSEGPNKHVRICAVDSHGNSVDTDDDFRPANPRVAWAASSNPTEF